MVQRKNFVGFPMNASILLTTIYTPKTIQENYSCFYRAKIITLTRHNVTLYYIKQTYLSTLSVLMYLYFLCNGSVGHLLRCLSRFINASVVYWKIRPLCCCPLYFSFTTRTHLNSRAKSRPTGTSRFQAGSAWTISRSTRLNHYELFDL